MWYACPATQTPANKGLITLSEPVDSETPETPKKRGTAPLVLAKAAARFEKATRKLERARARVEQAEEASKKLTEAEAEWREAKEEFDQILAARG